MSVNRFKKGEYDLLYIVIDMETENGEGTQTSLYHKINELGYTNRKMTSSTTMVSCDQTAEELANSIGIGENKSSGVVNAVENYSGFAEKDFVSWFRIHKNK